MLQSQSSASKKNISCCFSTVSRVFGRFIDDCLISSYRRNIELLVKKEGFSYEKVAQFPTWTIYRSEHFFYLQLNRK